jgi:hypothetical protein
MSNERDKKGTIVNINTDTNRISVQAKNGFKISRIFLRISTISIN